MRRDQSKQAGVPNEVFAGALGLFKNHSKLGIIPAGKGPALAGAVVVYGAFRMFGIIQNAARAFIRFPDLDHFMIGKLKAVVDIIPHQFPFTNGIQAAGFDFPAEKQWHITLVKRRARGKAAFATPFALKNKTFLYFGHE